MLASTYLLTTSLPAKGFALIFSFNPYNGGEETSTTVSFVAGETGTDTLSNLPEFVAESGLTSSPSEGRGGGREETQMSTISSALSSVTQKELSSRSTD